MGDVLSDIAADPAEYAPVLVFLNVVLVIWVLLTFFGWRSIRRTAARRARTWLAFFFAFTSFLLGLVGVMAQIPFSFSNSTFNFEADLRWLFLLPMLLGMAGLLFWFRPKWIKSREGAANHSPAGQGSH